VVWFNLKLNRSRTGGYGLFTFLFIG